MLTIQIGRSVIFLVVGRCSLRESPVATELEN